MSAAPARSLPDAVDVAVIGSGFSGLGMGIALKKEGRRSFVILEKAEEVGGTWRDNHYPGCACDVPSHLYSFSFEQNPGWTRMYSPQGEILDYLRGCARQYGLDPHLHLGAAVASADYDEAAALWRVRLADGRGLSARAVVSGMGGLSRPARPDIPGLMSFRGPMFHSAEWDHSCDLAGRTVAVIGTGASAIQFVPRIAPEVGKLHLFQRTAPWILKKGDRAVTRLERWLMRSVPGLMALFRAQIYWRLELAAGGFTRNPRAMRAAERLARRHLARQVADERLRARLTPDYTIGCKRILISNDYYPALARPNVELVTDAIAEVTPEGVRTRDGTLRKADVIILGTGFHAFDILSPVTVRGEGGRLLNEEWREGAHAYLGITVAGYPNLFFLMGPNTGLGHNSMIYMIESQIHYVMEALALMDREGVPAIAPREDVQARFNDALKAAFGHTVWATGCKSWYITKDGSNPTLWPDNTFRYRARTRMVAANDYVRVAPKRPQPRAAE